MVRRHVTISTQVAEASKEACREKLIASLARGNRVAEKELRLLLQPRSTAVRIANKYLG